MATANPKIVLSRSQDIPFNKLVLSQANVRRVKAGISIEELAEDIARRTLLHGLTVRPILDAEGTETGMFEVPVGGRRFRALELLVKQKRMAKTQPVPCVVRDSGLPEEDSLAENLQRVALHPLDQFRAFQTLRDAGLGEEDIAARFFVTPAIVKQRLKLAAVSPKLLSLYENDGMTLEQLMAFTVTNDHEHQERVWDALSHNKAAYYIRRLLTEGAVRASDKRAQFVGIAAYEDAGGIVMRDLFEQDEGGWLQDTALLDQLVAEKLDGEAGSIRAEGWKWVESAVGFPYGHAFGLRRIASEPLSEEEQAARDALHAEFDGLNAEYDGAEELPEAIDQRLAEIETALEAFDNRPTLYDTTEIARAGAFVSVDADGALRVERGYVRPEDEAPVESEPEAGADENGEAAEGDEPIGVVQPTGGASPDAATPTIEAADEDEGVKPLADRLVTELTAHRTLALRDALAKDPDIAFVAVLHALCLAAFYPYASGTCLEITAKSAAFSVQAPGLADTACAQAIDQRYQDWEKRLPENFVNLWDALLGFDSDSRATLFAHCAARTVNVVKEPWHRRPDAIAHGDRLAQAIGLDMAAASWTPTVDNYLGRVTKAQILNAVREAKGDAAARQIDHLKKPDMAIEAERLLADSAWLPEPLRTPTAVTTQAETDAADIPVIETEGIAAE